MFRAQNLCPGSKNVIDFRQKHFLFSKQQNLFPQDMFPAWLNWETFASATMFPSLTRPLRRQLQNRSCHFTSWKEGELLRIVQK